MHTAQRFFVQYKLWDIVTGDLANPAGDVEPSVTSGKIDLGETAGSIGAVGRILQGPPDPANLMKSKSTGGMSDTALRTIISLTQSNRTAPHTPGSLGVKRHPTLGRNLSPSTARGVMPNSASLRNRLHYLKKTSDVTMNKHIDKFSNLIEQIQFHSPTDKRWSGRDD